MTTNPTKMSFEGLLYYGAKGSTAATLLTNIAGDVTIKTTTNTAEITPRGDGSGPPVEDAGVVKITHELEFNLLNKTDDASLEAMRVAAAAAEPVALRGKDYAAGKGPDFDYYLTIEKGEPDGGRQTVKITAKATSQGGRPLTLAKLYC
jgi:hypothetical protein